MEQNNRPNFFLVGAPKCGTTFLYNSLRKHPEIYLPAEKELHYFASDLYPANYITESQYHSLFSGIKSEKVIGEASVWYLYSDCAAERIKKYNSDAKILIMLRNPIDMLRSLHSHFVFDNMENIENFEDALNAEPERKLGKNISPNIYAPIMIYYTELGKYFKYVKKYFDIFGEDNVHVILYDELSVDPDKTFLNLLKFLDVDENVSIKRSRDNVSKIPRFKLVSRIINPGAKVKALIRLFLPFKARRKLIEIIVKLNSKNTPSKQMGKEMMTKWNKLFVKDIDELSKLIKKDLAGWSE